MAADSALTEGAYRASRYIDLGERAAKQELGETLGNINIPMGKGKKQSSGGTIPSGGEADTSAGVGDNNAQLQEKVEEAELVQTPDEELTDEGNEKKDEVISEENADNNAADVEENPTSSNDTNNTNEGLLDLKEQYYDAVKNGDNNLAEQILNSIDGSADELEGWKEEISSTASNWTNRSKENGVDTPRGFGMSLEKDPTTKKWFSDFINSGEKLVTRNTGSGIEQGVIGPDGEWMTKNQYQKLKESFEVDNDSMNAIHTMSQKFYSLGSEAGPENNWDSNMAMNVQSQVANIVDQSLAKGNSIIYDSNFGHSSFFDDMVERDQLKGTPYSHLGIDASAFDTDGDGKLSADDEITEEDRKAIYEAAMTSDLLKDDRRQWLTNYFTEHIKRNYNASHNIVVDKHLKGAEVVDLK